MPVASSPTLNLCILCTLSNERESICEMVFCFIREQIQFYNTPMQQAVKRRRHQGLQKLMEKYCSSAQPHKNGTFDYVTRIGYGEKHYRLGETSAAV